MASGSPSGPPVASLQLQIHPKSREDGLRRPPSPLGAAQEGGTCHFTRLALAGIETVLTRACAIPALSCILFTA
jgi:hypothetical protein